MARKPRNAPGGLAYHVMNRTWGKIDLFEDAGDYEAFERVLAEAVERETTMRVCAYCLMPNHFHLVLWPSADGQLSRFMQWLSMTHTQRWHAHRHSAGRGHLYQSRFKSFVIQEDGHFLSVCRYVERNPLRANLVERAERWRWGSLWVRGQRDGPMRASLARWPMPMPRDWLGRVNQPQDEKELAALRRARDRGRPYGQDAWAIAVAKRLGIESSLRPIGRPPKKKRRKGL
jgi:putative transposase